MSSRVAVDANVLIAGIGWPRWQHEILMHAIAGDFSLVLPETAIEETRSRIGKDFPELLDRFEFFLSVVNYELASAPSREDIEANRGLVRDDADLPIALSVIDADVEYFVTYDRDFTDEGETTEGVRKAISASILLPPVFLRDVMGWTSEELEEVRHREWSDLVDG